jgi:hypothetical protein
MAPFHPRWETVLNSVSLAWSWKKCNVTNAGLIHYAPGLLTLISTGVSGPIPASLGNLSLMYELTLSESQFEGSLPDSLQNLSNLTMAMFNDNGLTGTLPEWLGMLSHLIELRVNDNDFSGSIPSTLCRANIQLTYDCNLLTCDCCDKLSSSPHLWGLCQWIQTSSLQVWL